jgi:hypothetical protein
LHIAPNTKLVPPASSVTTIGSCLLFCSIVEQRYKLILKLPIFIHVAERGGDIFSYHLKINISKFDYRENIIYICGNFGDSTPLFYQRVLHTVAILGCSQAKQKIITKI